MGKNEIFPSKMVVCLYRHLLLFKKFEIEIIYNYEYDENVLARKLHVLLHKICVIRPSSYLHKCNAK